MIPGRTLKHLFLWESSILVKWIAGGMYLLIVLGVICQAAERLSTLFKANSLCILAWGAWSWIPLLLYYWGILILLITWGGGGEAIRRWLRPSRRSRWI